MSLPSVPVGAWDLRFSCVMEGAKLPETGFLELQQWQGRLVCSRSSVLGERSEMFGCLGILDGEGEEMFAIMVPGLGHQLGVGEAAFCAALGGLEAKITEVSFFSCMSGGLGWKTPFLPSLHPSGGHQVFLHSLLLPAASQGEIHPSPLRPALGHLFCWLSTVPSLACPRGAKPIFLEVFQPSCNSHRFIPHLPMLEKEGRFAAWGRRAGRTPGFWQRCLCHHPAPAERGHG